MQCTLCRSVHSIAYCVAIALICRYSFDPDSENEAIDVVLFEIANQAAEHIQIKSCPG